jgi:16S rRNA (guanine527-N7)-methyltransferase
MLLQTEQDVQRWFVTALNVSRETLDKLAEYVALLRAANKTQNLIAASTVGEDIWCRHIADSAQLLPLAGESGRRWIDLGSGPGLPGLIIAICDPRCEVMLVEARRARAQFLEDCCRELGLAGRVRIAAVSLDRVQGEIFDVISARAFAPLSRLVPAAARFSAGHTRWVLPKGRAAQNELSEAPASWQRLFHVEPSLTSADGLILVGTGNPLQPGQKT